MAVSPCRPILAAIFLSFLFSQGHAIPNFIKVWFEPPIIFIRYRAAAVVNQAGVGIGGILSKIGESVNTMLSYFGDRMNVLLSNIAKLFNAPDQLRDDQQDTYKQLMFFKEQYIRNGEFSYANSRRRSLKPVFLKVKRSLLRFLKI